MRDAHSNATLASKNSCPTGRARTKLPRSLVVVLAAVVHGLGTSVATALDTTPLPTQVADLRELLIAAVRSGNADDLKVALEWNEVRPDLGFDSNVEPIGALKAASADGAGHETLAALGDILELPPAALPLGKDLENNLIYVWPYLAEKPLDTLSAAELVDLYRLVPAAKVSEMREKKRWTWWRLVIGADGNWHMFKKMD